MLPNNFTSKSQEAIQIAQMLANENGQQAVEPIHLLAALAHQEDGIVVTIFKKMGTPIAEMRTNINHIIESLPKNFGFGQSGMGQVLLSPMLAKVLQVASNTAKDFGDDYISTEHLLLGLISNRQIKKFLETNNVNEERTLETLKEVRGNQKVDSADPEAKFTCREKTFQEIPCAQHIVCYCLPRQVRHLLTFYAQPTGKVVRLHVPSEVYLIELVRGVWKVIHLYLETLQIVFRAEFPVHPVDRNRRFRPMQQAWRRVGC